MAPMIIGTATWHSIGRQTQLVSGLGKAREKRSPAFYMDGKPLPVGLRYLAALCFSHSGA